jgi:hypothetical protein
MNILLPMALAVSLFEVNNGWGFVYVLFTDLTNYDEKNILKNAEDN